MPIRSILSASILLLTLASSKVAASEKEDAALDHARRAALIQTGIQGFSDKLVAYAESEAKKKLVAIGVAEPLAVGAYGYKLYREQAVDLRISPSCTVRLGVTSARIQVGF